MCYPAGLDVQNRPTLLELLHSLHAARNPRVIIGLRTQDPVPDWITHVAFVRGGKAITGPKEEVLSTVTHDDMEKSKASTGKAFVATAPQGKLLVEMKNVNVKYGPRTVSSIPAINIFVIHADNRVIRSSKTSTGRSGKAKDGTFKAPTVSLPFPPHNVYLTH
jgi:hypothetical protein